MYICSNCFAVRWYPTIQLLNKTKKDEKKNTGKKKNHAIKLFKLNAIYRSIDHVAHIVHLSICALQCHDIHCEFMRMR